MRRAVDKFYSFVSAGTSIEVVSESGKGLVSVANLSFVNNERLFLAWYCNRMPRPPTFGIFRSSQNRKEAHSCPDFSVLVSVNFTSFTGVAREAFETFFM